MLNFLAIDFPTFLCLQILSIPVYVILHEFGHAIPAAWLTKGEVQVFIGSYGDKTKSFKFSCGLFAVWVKFNPLTWKKGLSRPTAKNIALNKHLIYTFWGPATPFLIASIWCLFITKLNVHGLTYSFSFVFLFYSFIMFLIGVTPIETKVKAYNGETIYNDGYALRKMYRLKKYNREYTDAIQFYNGKEYKKAGDLFNFLILKKIGYEEIYRGAVISFNMAGDYESASNTFIYFKNAFALTSDDYCNGGIAQLHKKNYSSAKVNFEQSLSLNPNNPYTLNNIGYNYILTNEYEKAILHLDKAISINATFSHAYTNRGLAKVKLGKTVDGFSDLTRAMELDASNAYTHRNLGIYYQDNGDYANALSLYKKAFELDEHTHLINELIKETEDCLLKQKFTN